MPQMAAKEYRAHDHISARAPLPIASVASRWRSLRRWYRHSILRALVTESRALGHRIRWILDIRAVELLGGRDEVRKWMDEALAGGSQSYKRAYISHMQQIVVRYPFLSIFDQILLAKSWKAGSEWNAQAGTLRSQECKVHSCNQFSQVPDAGTDTSSHSGGHAQG